MSAVHALANALAGTPAAAGSGLGGWFHTLSPFLVEFSQGVGLRWYGLAYAAAFVWGWLYLRWAAKRGVSLIPADRVGDAILWIILGVVVGGRLGYVLFYEVSLLWSFSDSLPYWGVLAINKGGMASHGGMIGVILASWRISRGWKPFEPDAVGGDAKAESGVGPRRIGRCPMLHVLDVLASCAPIGLLFGRLANFVNGELLGRIVAMPGQRAPWWAVRYPQEVTSGHDAPRTDEQVRALDEVIAAYARDGDSVADAWDRVLHAVHRGDAGLVERLEPLISARVPSQLVQGFCEGVVLAVVLWTVARVPRKPGVIGCWFLIAYGLMRIGTEFVRLPDDHLADPRIMGLTRGQWLSGLMIAAGVGFLFWVSRRSVERLGGWARPKATAERANPGETSEKPAP
ncbi:MAG: prolipoprotein diacylglyceryl transferase [Phycisphaeraceae bacterium]|nr:prolipoprotein diacylglyceryl transferase [Phycisphaeraceae bacterium]